MKHIVILAFLAFFAGISLAQDTTQQALNAQGWIQQNSGTTNGFGSVKFTSADTGWVASGGGVILRTVDGGQHWVQLPVPDPLGVSCIDAVDGKTAWCSDDGSHGNMFFTNDGGQSWIQQIPNSGGSGIESLAFPTRNTGFGVGGTLGFLIKTTNGGQSWTNYTLGPGYLYTVNFLDSLNGLIAGDGIMYRIINGGPGRIVQKDTTFSIVDLYGCWLASPSREFAVGVEAASNGVAVIVRSTDGGNSWARATLPDKFKLTILQAITFTDSLHGTVVGSNGGILHTTDGGDTWNQQESGVKADLNSVSFVDSLTGTIVGAGGVILRTANGGDSWVQPNSNLDSLSVQMYPDPANQNINISYILPVPQTVTLSILSLSGQQVSLVLNSVFETDGQHTIPITISSFASGTYIYQLQTEKYFSTGQFIIYHS